MNWTFATNEEENLGAPVCGQLTEHARGVRSSGNFPGNRPCAHARHDGIVHEPTHTTNEENITFFRVVRVVRELLENVKSG